MDLSTVMTKIDTHQYLTVKDFLVDVDLICNNALEYNPDKDPGGEWEEWNRNEWKLRPNAELCSFLQWHQPVRQDQ